MSVAQGGGAPCPGHVLYEFVKTELRQGQEAGN